MSLPAPTKQCQSFGRAGLSPKLYFAFGESHADRRSSVQVFSYPVVGRPCAAARQQDACTFYVDDYEVGDVGTCNLDNWVSFASNQDFMAVTSPSCVVRIGVPVEIGVAI